MVRKRKSKYDVDYFIKKFSAIPRSKWCTNSYMKAERRCAFGHCGRGFVWVGGAHVFTDTWEAISLEKIVVDGSVASINDGKDPRFPQKTPKGRILAALRRIKKMRNLDR